VRVTTSETNPNVRNSTREADDRKILIVIDAKRIAKIVETGIHKGFVNAKADNGDTNSIQVMAKMALSAMKKGANVLYLKAEGAHRKVEAFGWGIGFSQVKASEDNMSTGGTGISGGSSGPEDRPWLQGHMFVDPTVQDMLNKLPGGEPEKKAEVKKAPEKKIAKKIAPVKAPAVAKKAPAQTGNHTSAGSTQ
jgi:hypothetical protein